MEMVTILGRTMLTYFFLLVLLRLMGKRELGKLSVFDVVISIMLAEMAVLAIEETNKPALHFFIPMILIALLELAMAWLSLKSKRLRDTMVGSAEVIIEHGQIREEAMRRNRLSLDDLMVHLRQKNIKNLADVEFAVLEPTGQMSVFPREQVQPVTREDLNLKPKPPVAPVTYQGLPIPLILDGKIRDEALEKIGQNKFWLIRELRKRGIKAVKDVSFCSLDERGILYIDKKDKPSR